MGEYYNWSLQYRSQVDAVIADVKETPKIINDAVMLIRQWESGTMENPISYEQGEVRSESGNPYKCRQTHTHSGETGWNPSSAPALWVQYHGTSYATARVFIHPTGAHDIYLLNEYMIFTDKKIYRCIAANGTSYSPTEYAAAWEIVTDS